MTDKKPTSSTQTPQGNTSQHKTDNTLPVTETKVNKNAGHQTPKNHSPTDKPLKEQANPSTKTQAKKTDPRSIGRRSLRKNIAYLLFVVMLLVFFAAVAYGLWQFWRVQDTRITAAQQQQSSLSVTVDKQTEQLQQQLSEQQNKLTLFIQQSTKEQQLLQQRLNAQLATINTLSGISRDGWMLEEARHLLRLANQRQLTGSNVSGIVGLLQAADDILREIDLPGLFPIREKIQHDLVALKIAPSVDREGIYLQLNSLISKVEGLPPAPITLSLKEHPATDKVETPPQPIDQEIISAIDQTLWQKVTASVNSAMGSLDNYVRITHHDKKIEPLLSDAQQLLSQENLRVMLEQAQIALLREEAVVYQQSVEKSVEWLHKYYSHYPEKIAMVALLNELKVQPILSELPSVAASLYTLSQYIDSHSQATNKTTTAVSEKKRILPNKNDTTDEIKSIKPKAVKNVSEPSVEAVK